MDLELRLYKLTKCSLSYMTMAVCSSFNVENIVPTLKSAITDDAFKMSANGRPDFARKIEKQMRAHPHVRLGHGSKRTAHVRVDTSYIF